MGTPERLKCDAIGCKEDHPVTHEEVGKPGFGYGRWLGWLYLDLNRPDLATRPLRFCSVFCLRWWIEHTTTADKPITNLDAFLSAPAMDDQLAARRTKKAPSTNEAIR